MPSTTTTTTTSPVTSVTWGDETGTPYPLETAVERELAELRAEVKRLRFDEARINWMQENYTDTEFISSGEFREGCLREEIDFIMRGGSHE